MNRPAALFLIFLRLAIGWHFLVEGFQKIPSEQLTALGLPTNNKSFSSAGYFREAPGPFGDLVRQYDGDPDEATLARLTLEDAPVNQQQAKERLPKALRADWESYLAGFSAHYGLDEAQKAKAKAELDAAATEMVRLLTYKPEANAEKRDEKLYKKSVTIQTRKFPSGDVQRDMTLSDRLAEYRAKLDELREASGQKLWLFGKDVEGAKLKTRKVDVAAMRGDLTADLDKQTKALKDALYGSVLTQEQRMKEDPKADKARGVIGYMDLTTPWMLTGVGACLLVGLFSRLASFVGAGFLLMTYLAVPAWPWLPAAGPTEGNYLFVNKNLIEMLALCVLMCVPTGRWFGVDAILHAFGRLFFGDKPQPAKV